MIGYFGGVIIWTADLQQMVAFYRDILELPVHSLHADFAAFEVGGIRISVGLHSAVHGRNTEGTRVMANLGVSDIFSVYERLRARSVAFIRPPEREHWGGWIATFVDPDGNVLQLLQQAGVPSTEQAGEI